MKSKKELFIAGALLSVLVAFTLSNTLGAAIIGSIFLYVYIQYTFAMKYYELAQVKGENHNFKKPALDKNVQFLFTENTNLKEF